MTTSDQYAKKLRTELEALLTVLPAALARMSDYSGGFPSGGSPNGNGHSDRTQTLALRHDPLDRERRALKHDIETLTQTIAGLNTRCRITLNTQPNRLPDPECAPCAQHAERRVTPYMHVQANNGKGITTRIPLCRWHHDTWTALGVIAGPATTSLHHQGKTLRSNQMRAAFAHEHPTEWATYLTTEQAQP